MMARRLMTKRPAIASGPLYNVRGAGGAFMMIKAADGFVRPVRVLQSMEAGFYGYVGEDEFTAGSQGEIRRFRQGGGLSSPMQVSQGSGNRYVAMRDRIVYFSSEQWRVRAWDGTELGLAGIPGGSNSLDGMPDEGRTGWMVDSGGGVGGRQRTSGWRILDSDGLKTSSVWQIDEINWPSGIGDNLAWRLDEGLSPIVGFGYPSDLSFRPPAPPGSEFAEVNGSAENWRSRSVSSRRVNGEAYVLMHVVASEIRLGASAGDQRWLSIAQRRTLALYRLDQGGPILDRVLSRETWQRPWGLYGYTEGSITGRFDIQATDHPYEVIESFGPQSAMAIPQVTGQMDVSTGRLYLSIDTSTSAPHFWRLDLLDSASEPQEITHPLTAPSIGTSVLIALAKEGLLVATSLDYLTRKTEEWHSPDQGVTWTRRESPQFIAAGAAVLEPLYWIAPPPPEQGEGGE